MVLAPELANVFVLASAIAPVTLCLVTFLFDREKSILLYLGTFLLACAALSVEITLAAADFPWSDVPTHILALSAASTMMLGNSALFSSKIWLRWKLLILAGALWLLASNLASLGSTLSLIPLLVLYATVVLYSAWQFWNFNLVNVWPRRLSAATLTAFAAVIAAYPFLRKSAELDHPWFALTITFAEIALACIIATHLANSVRRISIEKNKLSPYVERSPFPILVLGERLKILSANAAAEKTFGHQREELLSKTLLELALADQQSKIIEWVETIPGREKLEGEFLCMRKSGERFPARLTATALPDMTVLAFCEDRSQEKIRTHEKLEAQELLARSARMASMGELTAVAVHEIRNHLTVIKTSQELLFRLAREGRLNEETAPNLCNHLGSGIDKLDFLTRSLLTISRGTSDEMEKADLCQAITENLSFILVLLKKDNIETQVEIPKLPILVMINLGALSQILINLIVNARDATEGLDHRKVVVRCMRLEDVARIEIEDNGIGIPEELHERIFDTFFTTKKPGHGTGLGLAVSRKLVKKMGGTISVRSKKDSGSKFRVDLPLLRGDPHQVG